MSPDDHIEQKSSLIFYIGFQCLRSKVAEYLIQRVRHRLFNLMIVYVGQLKPARSLFY